MLITMVLDESKYKETFDNIFDGVNSSLPVDFENALFERLDSEHRTLQSNFWRMIKNIAVKYSETPKNRQDARNKFAVILAKRIAEIDEYLPHI